MKSVLLLGLIWLTSFVSESNQELFFKSRFIVEGLSNRHEWVLESKVADVQAIAFLQNDQLFITKLEGMVPVKSLQNINPFMTDDAQFALKATQFPTISFDLIKVIESNIASGDVLGLVRLEIAGEVQLINFVVKTEIIDQEFVKINGWKSVKMSDFNVKAPQFLNGAIQANDDIVVRFELSVPLSDPALVSELSN